MQKTPWRRIAASCIVLASFCFVVGMFATFLTDKNATERDFIEYWAAGQQLVHGANPYDPAAIYDLERAAGLDKNQPKVTFSPPVAFFLVLPLGLAGPKTGLICWLVTIIGCLIVSIWLIWILNGRPDNGLQFAAILFAPALACLMAGQLGTFLLLGLVLFLYLYDSRPFVAGAALLPCALKPHLFLAFAIVLLLWILMRKAYRILIGFGSALLVSCLLILCFDIHIWSQYSQMMSATGVLHSFVPTLSVAFRFLVDRDAVWLQFLPEIAACCWAAWYFWTRRNRWNWMHEGLLVLLVSVFCAPYAWFSDEAVVLPAVLTGVFVAANRGRSLIPIAVVAGAALAELYVMGQMASRLYLWTTPAWLACYLYATWGEDRHASAFSEQLRVTR